MTQVMCVVVSTCTHIVCIPWLNQSQPGRQGQGLQTGSSQSVWEFSVFWVFPLVLGVYTRWHARKAEQIQKLDSGEARFFGTGPDGRVRLWSPHLICDCSLFAPRMKCPLAGTNKRFLINTIKNTLPSHKEQDHEQKEDSKEPAKSQSQKEEGRQKHRSHPYKHSVHTRRSPPGKRGKRGGHEKSQSRSSKR